MPVASQFEGTDEKIPHHLNEQRKNTYNTRQNYRWSYLWHFYILADTVVLVV